MKSFSLIPALSRKQYLDTLLVLVNAELADSLCGVIDGIMVGRYLGADAMAAHGIAIPIFMIMNVFTYLITMGFQQPCTVSIGRGELRKANGMYSFTLILALVFSGIFALSGLLSPRGIARLMGAPSSGIITDMSADYLRAVFMGVPSLFFFVVLIPVLQIDGCRRLVHIGSLVMAVSDIAFDLLNIKVLGWGMFGMGLATSVSYSLGLLVLLVYFFRKQSFFHFRLRDIPLSDIRHMFLMGLPATVWVGSWALASVLINVLVMRKFGATAMTALAVRENLYSIPLAVAIGLSGTTLLLTGISFGERDRRGLMDVVRMSAKYSILLMGGLGVVIYAFAPLLVTLYLEPSAEAFPLAVKAIRYLAVAMPLVAWVRCVGSYLQGIEEINRSMVVFVVEELVVLLPCAWLMGSLWGIGGVFAAFPVSQLLAILLLNLQVFLHRDRRFKGMEAYLCVPADFGVLPQDRIVRNLTSREEVWALAAEAMDFCLDHGLSRGKAYMCSLYIEEMGNIIMIYGFADNKPHNLEIHLSIDQEKVILRFRDDCHRFDILEKAGHWEEDPEHPETSLGVRLITSACKTLRYDNSLSTNNLMVLL